MSFDTSNVFQKSTLFQCFPHRFCFKLAHIQLPIVTQVKHFIQVVVVCRNGKGLLFETRGGMNLIQKQMKMTLNCDRFHQNPMEKGLVKTITIQCHFHLFLY